jgi:hypothetical protein
MISVAMIVAIVDLTGGIDALLSHPTHIDLVDGAAPGETLDLV